jgi:hypothetical protein
VGCGGDGRTFEGVDGTAPPTALRELANVQTIRDAFAADEGHARLVLFLSPT